MYTGAHRQRFDEEGRGRGVYGRDRIALGPGSLGSSPHRPNTDEPVYDLSQITRGGLDSGGGTLLTSAQRHRVATGGNPPPTPPRSPPRTGTSSVNTSFSAPQPNITSPMSLRSPPPAAAAPAHSPHPGTLGGEPVGPVIRSPRSLAVVSGDGAPLDLRRVFVAYCAFGMSATQGVPDEMDNSRFAKLVREAGLMAKLNGTTGNGTVSSATVDITFNRCKTPQLRTLTYDQFVGALGLLGAAAWPKLPPAEGGERALAAALATGGPALSGVASPATSKGVFAKLTDERLYTGMYKRGVEQPSPQVLGESQSS